MTKLEPIHRADFSPLPPDLKRKTEEVATARIPVFAMLSFLVLVVLPVSALTWYSLALAADRYASRTAFSIRANEAPMPTDLAGILTGPAGGSAMVDAQILYDFIHSQEMVERISGRFDLAALFAAAPDDRVFYLPPDAPIEDFVDHWARMVDVGLDPSSGILTVEARAFAPEDARRIASAVLAESADLANRLSAEARRRLVEATARELDDAEDRLRAIRKELRTFRDTQQEVDPTLNAAAALELVTTLEGDLARESMKLDELSGVLSADSPQIRTLRRRIATLTARIAEERTRLGRGIDAHPNAAAPGPAFSTLVGRYEELVVDREFAEQAYTMALAAHQQALADARRLHRHLAIHVSPTLSQEAEYPDRPLLIVIGFVVCLAGWGILHLVLGNVAERR